MEFCDGHIDGHAVMQSKRGMENQEYLDSINLCQWALEILGMLFNTIEREIPQLKIVDLEVRNNTVN